jgi:hypothetical protein
MVGMVASVAVEMQRNRLTVSYLESLEGVGTFRLLSQNVEDRVYKFRACVQVSQRLSHHLDSLTLGIEPFCPIISRPALTMHKGIRTEEIGHRSRSNKIEDSWLEVDLDRPWDILAVRGLVEVDVDWDASALRDCRVISQRHIGRSLRLSVC